MRYQGAQVGVRGVGLFFCPSLVSPVIRETSIQEQYELFTKDVYHWLLEVRACTLCACVRGHWIS